MESDEVMAELGNFFGANAARVKSILQMWNAYADMYNALCDEWTSDSDAYRNERAYRALKGATAYLERLNAVSNRRHKSCYPHQFMTVVPRQMQMWGDLWRFSTRSVEGRGGQLKKIGRRIICWRRRCAAGSYQRNVKRKGVAHAISQGYSYGPERMLMRASCFREDRAHTQKRSRAATTGRNTLARSVPKAEQAELPALGDALELTCVKRMCAMERKVGQL